MLDAGCEPYQDTCTESVHLKRLLRVLYQKCYGVDTLPAGEVHVVVLHVPMSPCIML